MGGGRWEAKDWDDYSTKTTVGKSTREIYTSRKMDTSLDPKSIEIRESCDSDDNPNSNAVIVGLDVTGSMHSVLDAMARDGL